MNTVYIDQEFEITARISIGMKLIVLDKNVMNLAKKQNNVNNFQAKRRIMRFLLFTVILLFHLFTII